MGFLGVYGRDRADVDPKDKEKISDRYKKSSY